MSNYTQKFRLGTVWGQVGVGLRPTWPSLRTFSGWGELRFAPMLLGEDRRPLSTSMGMSDIREMK